MISVDGPGYLVHYTYTERSVIVNHKVLVMSKTAIVVFSDPKAGSEEALGRLFNAMFLTLELKDKGQNVALIFQGAGVRWPAEVVQPTHPAHALYHAVADKVAGVCGGCADVFGATEAAKTTGCEPACNFDAGSKLLAGSQS
jgi:DsrE/DsrF-like family